MSPLPLAGEVAVSAAGEGKEYPISNKESPRNNVSTGCVGLESWVVGSFYVVRRSFA